MTPERGNGHVFNPYKGHGKSLKSTGPPRPASASNKDMITAIAASSLSVPPSDVLEDINSASITTGTEDVPSAVPAVSSINKKCK